METPDEALEAIAEQIKEGFTSGRVDILGTYTAWSIQLETWKA